MGKYLHIYADEVYFRYRRSNVRSWQRCRFSLNLKTLTI